MLTDLAAPDARHLHTLVKEGSYKGPYLARLKGLNNAGVPLNPLTCHLQDGRLSDANIDHSWRYDAKRGEVHSEVSGKTLDGKQYGQL